MRTSIVVVGLLLVAQLAAARVRGIKSVNQEYEEFRRHLTQLMGYGAEPDAQHFPLQLCEGDCDCDHHCDEGLVCFQRDARYGPIPSCLNGENFDADTDFCVPSSSPRTNAQMPSCPTDTSIIEPALQAPEATADPTTESTAATTPEATEEAAATAAAATAAPSLPENTQSLPPVVFVGDSVVTVGRPLGLCVGKHMLFSSSFFTLRIRTNKTPPKFFIKIGE
jgi:hypothetical protein